MNEEMFYGTLPQDTQDFSQVLRGVGRSIKDIGRGVSYYPYDLIGAPVDIINMALQPVGLGSERPVLGSDYLRNIAQSLGYAQPSTGSGAETAARFAAGLTNPAAGARAVGQAGNLVTKGANLSADKLVQMITGNPQATAPRVLEETSMPFMQAMAPRTPTAPSLLEPQKSDIGFYSQLEAATIPLQNKGTGDQYLAQISKTAGVKPEEIQWTGLDEFLKGKKSVSKDEILNYLNTNRVDVQEVRLGEYPEGRSYGVFGDDVDGYYVSDPDGSRDVAGPFDNIFDAERAAEDFTVREMESGTKFSKYTLPGGENYREILLTLPFKEPAMPKGYNIRSVQYDDGSFRYFAETPTTSSAAYKTEAEAQAELQRMAGSLKDFRASLESYRSTHFDQPNILAHMRVNDRVVDGKKTLFIEEIQSDWHQAGRKKGYQVDKAVLDRQFDKLASEYQNVVQRRTETIGIPEFADEYNALQKEEVRLIAEMNRIHDQQSGVVPDAPFKTSWHELSLKRAIQEASEKGYDQIAFTTGKTQAERYDLSKQVDSINVPMVNQDGTRSVRIEPTNGVSIKLMVDENGVVTGYGSSSSQFTGKPLDEVIGKEMAEKVMKSEAGANFSGGDLAIGGEGMKGFYDNILPKSLDKLAKKFDAKVGKTFIEGERTRDASGIPSMYPEKIEVWQMDITPKMRESVTTKGQPLFAVPAVGAGLLGAGMMQDEEMF
jgi:hypothetical protein